MSFLAHTRSIISPSPSSAPSMTADESDMERRRELSPSPEVDLSSPEFDDRDDDFAMPGTPVGSFSTSGFYMRPRPVVHSTSARHGRAGSPPLEKDEKEFTQTADGLQRRKLNDDLSPSNNAAPADPTASIMDLERDESSLFGVIGGFAASLVSSPAIRPSTMSLNYFGKKDGDVDGWAKYEGMLEWDRSPENIALEELDGLLLDY